MWTTLALALCLQDPGNPHTDLRRLIADRDPDARARAVEMLRKDGDAGTVPALLLLLGDAHPRVRARAVQALSRMGDPADLPPLVRPGLASSRPHVRLGVCEALGLARQKAAVPLLLDRLSDPDPDVRAGAAAALGGIGEASAAERLAATFRRYRDWPTRATVLEALARLAPEQAKPLLSEAAADASYQVRMLAAESMPRAGGNATFEALPALLNDPDWRVRASAIGACLELRTRAVVGWLADRLGREKGRLRWNIVSALHDLTGKDLGLAAPP